MHKKAYGFTIVELLIVIVVIAILAAISVVAYTGIQNRANDSRRANDLANIEKALRAYETIYGGVKKTRGIPSPYTGGVSYQGWDSSVSASWLSFLRADHGNMPVDPVNTMTSSNNPPSAGNRNYFYFCYDSVTFASMSPSDPPYVRIGYHKSDDTLVDRRINVSACID